SEFWRVVLVSVNNLLFSLAVGMFCSAISKDERKALVLAFVIVLFFTAILPLLGAIQASWRHALPAPFFFIPSPGFSSYAAFDATYRLVQAAKFGFFYHSVSCVQAMTWALLLATATIVPRSWQDRAESARRMRFRQWWRGWAHGSAATRLAVRRRLL